MECKLGYGGPLCALCSDGYFKSLRDCVPCEHPQLGAISVVAVLALLLVAVVLFLARKYRRFLRLASIFSREYVL
jgi:hypothetical protein